jgi:DNA-binding GntR family transcriptional regulator
LAYAHIRAAIQNGRLRAGDRLSEADVAGWLGVSRTPVRDALKRLESEGLLSSARRRGLVVAELDQQQVTELYAVRDVLEGLAGGLAAKHATSAEIAAMRELLERQARTHADDLPALARLNQLFHDVVCRAARNRYLTNLLDTLESSLALLPGTTYSAPGRAATALREHTTLVDAVERHDQDRAQHVARQHMRAAEGIRLRMISGGEFLAVSRPDHDQRPVKRKHEPTARGPLSRTTREAGR